MKSRPVLKTIWTLNHHDVRSLLEMGCGEGGILSQFDIQSKVGIDHFEPSLIKAIENHPDAAYIKYDIRKLHELFLQKCFDAVILFDVLEHFESVDLLNIVLQAERLSRKCVAFFSPLGEEGLKACQEPLDGNESMIHRSIITEDFFNNLGYDTFLYEKYHKETVDAVLAIKVF